MLTHECRVPRSAGTFYRALSRVHTGTSADQAEVAELRLRRRNASMGKGSGMPWSDADEKKLHSSVDEGHTACLSLLPKP